MPSDVIAFGDAITHAVSAHETILQTLNRWMDFGEGKRLFYGVENFEGTEPNWDKVPLIFALNHPDVDQMRRIEKGELNQVLKEINGSLCGEITSSEVVMAGQPSPAGSPFLILQWRHDITRESYLSRLGSSASLVTMDTFRGRSVRIMFWSLSRMNGTSLGISGRCS